MENIIRPVPSTTISCKFLDFQWPEKIFSRFFHSLEVRGGRKYQVFSRGEVGTMIPMLLQGSHSFRRKNSRSFPVQFQNFPGAFGHSSQPNIKHIWTAIVTKRLPNIIECNQCQYLLWKVCCKNICTVLCFYMRKSTYYAKNSRSNIKFQEFSRFTIFQEFSRWVGTLF